jgi:hypothetical protein
MQLGLKNDKMKQLTLESFARLLQKCCVPARPQAKAAPRKHSSGEAIIKLQTPQLHSFWIYVTTGSTIMKNYTAS